MSAKQILITQTRSSNRRIPKQKLTLQALGLGRIGRSVVQEDTSSVLGMVRKVSHLVTVCEHQPSPAAK